MLCNKNTWARAQRMAISNEIERQWHGWRETNITELPRHLASLRCGEKKTRHGAREAIETKQKQKQKTTKHQAATRLKLEKNIHNSKLSNILEWETCNQMLLGL